MDLFIFIFFAMPGNMWDLSSPKEIELSAVEAWSLKHWTTRKILTKTRLRQALRYLIF